MTFDDLSPLHAGNVAPDFTVPDQFGNDVTLSHLVSAKPVVLAFVPAAFTKTCTGEFCELRDNVALFEDASVQLLGISTDPKGALRVWGENDGLNFPLLSDFWPHGAVSSAYGVFMPEYGFATRATFVIDARMTIRSAFVHPPGQARPLAAYRQAILTMV